MNRHERRRAKVAVKRRLMSRDNYGSLKTWDRCVRGGAAARASLARCRLLDVVDYALVTTPYPQRVAHEHNARRHLCPQHAYALENAPKKLWRAEALETQLESQNSIQH